MKVLSKDTEWLPANSLDANTEKCFLGDCDSPSVQVCQDCLLVHMCDVHVWHKANEPDRPVCFDCFRDYMNLI